MSNGASFYNSGLFDSILIRPLSFTSVLFRHAFRYAGLFGLLSAAIRPMVAAAQEALTLRLQTELIERRNDDGAELPAFLSADTISGTSDSETVMKGNAEVRKAGSTLKADVIIYDAPADEVRASGNVRTSRGGLLMTGPSLRMKLSSYEGTFDQPTYYLKDINGHGKAERIDFEGSERLKMQNPNYTTCDAPNAENADWYIRADTLELDGTREEGVAHDGRVYFKQVPILASPILSFPLTDKRKSGLLSPSFGVTSRGGAELLQPYYLDIAPNRDLVVNTRLVSKRGLQYGGIARYLEPTFFGDFRFERLDGDRQTNSNRYSMLAIHTYNNGKGLYGGWNINKVSDDQYFVDFSRTLAAASQRSLPRDFFLSYARPDYTLTGRITRYQTLQDPAALITPPYDRLPQLLFNGQKLDVAGADLNVTAEVSGFSHPTLVQGQRIAMRPSISYPLLTPAFSITPRLSLQAVSYDLNHVDPGQNTRQSSSIPIASLDAKVTLERPTRFLGRSFLQTLEPRLYYLYAPYREQNQQPLFDTAATDFNFAQIFAENRYSGLDRVGDANQLTAAAVSRLIDEGTGIERLRFAVGQRYNFTETRLVIPGQPTTNDRSLSDFLAAVSGAVRPGLTVDGAIQVGAESRQLSRSNLGIRYRPSTSRLLNVNYRYTRDALDQFDISGQWPLAPKISAVGRFNYSIRENRLIESLGGIEYNGGCWVVRGVGQQFATSTGTSNTSLFVQLQLNGFGNIGSNPLDLLKRNVPGYLPGTPAAAKPSVFMDYE